MSIAKRYIIYTFLIVFLIGCVFTPIKIISSYRREVDRMSQQIHQIHKSHTPFLISSLWLTHYDLLQKQIESIVHFPYIPYVEIQNDEGRIFSAAEDSLGSDKIDIEKIEKYESYNENLYYTYRGEEVYLGKMLLCIDSQGMRSDVFAREMPYLVFQFISAIVLAAAVSFLFQRLVGRHLKQFADYLQKQNPKNLTVPFSFYRRRANKDELESLASAVNTMRATLDKSFSEKDLLLREIHHRVKNNMAAMDGLLRLQERSIDNPNVTEFINQAQSRLRSMSVLYDRLHSVGALREMSVKDYLPDLVKELTRIFPGQEHVEIYIDTADIVMDTGILSTLGIILNELVTNSFKYAFPGGKDGKIDISVQTAEQQKAEILYRDDGIGTPQTVINGENWGLGMLLINSMVKQLKGSVELKNDAGTVCHIKFPIGTDSANEY